MTGGVASTVIRRHAPDEPEQEEGDQARVDDGSLGSWRRGFTRPAQDARDISFLPRELNGLDCDYVKERAEPRG